MKLDIDQADLRPIVSAVVSEVLDNRSSATLATDRLAYPEGEAAAMLGVPKHVLRDARLRGEIKGRLLGKKIIYSRDALQRFAAASK